MDELIKTIEQYESFIQQYLGQFEDNNSFFKWDSLSSITSKPIEFPLDQPHAYTQPQIAPIFQYIKSIQYPIRGTSADYIIIDNVETDFDIPAPAFAIDDLIIYENIEIGGTTNMYYEVGKKYLSDTIINGDISFNNLPKCPQCNAKLYSLEMEFYEHKTADEYGSVYTFECGFRANIANVNTNYFKCEAICDNNTRPTPAEPQKCDCPMTDLMRYGCRCGGI